MAPMQTLEGAVCTPAPVGSAAKARPVAVKGWAMQEAACHPASAMMVAVSWPLGMVVTRSQSRTSALQQPAVCQTSDVRG